MKWFRLYSEFRTDKKIRKLSDSQKLWLIYLLCIASESETRGTISTEFDELAAEVECDEVELSNLLSRLNKLNIATVERSKDQCNVTITFNNWNKRQVSRSTHRKEYQQKYYEKRKESQQNGLKRLNSTIQHGLMVEKSEVLPKTDEIVEDVPFFNHSTRLKRLNSTIQHGLMVENDGYIYNSNSLNNINNTNTKIREEYLENNTSEVQSQEKNEGKKKKSSKVANVENLNVPFSDWWNAYDKKTGRTICEKKWERLKDEERVSALDHTKRYVLATPDAQYRKNPETYLNQKAWTNEYLPTPRNTNGKYTALGGIAPSPGKYAGLLEKAQEKRNANVA